jgi:hypothetical protein
MNYIIWTNTRWFLEHGINGISGNHGFIIRFLSVFRVQIKFIDPGKDRLAGSSHGKRIIFASLKVII